MTEAIVQRRRWPGLIWALPLAALLIAGWLGIRALTDRGTAITLDVQGADGVRPGDTHVTYNGLEVGTVSDISIAPDPSLIRLTLRIMPTAVPLLRTGTQFWVIGAKPNFTDLSSLRATFAGFSIGMAPGPGAPRRAFIAVERGPAIAPGTPGTRFRLSAKEVVSIAQGTSIYTHGWQVGTILGTSDFRTDGVELDAFVRAPYDRLVQPGTRFWDASAIQLIPGAGGLEARLTSPEIAAVGGVSFETPPEAGISPRAPADSRFILYSDSAQAENAPIGPEILYQIAFEGAVGQLQRGAPVSLSGFTIGRVLSTRLAFNPQTARLTTPVTIGLDPVKLHVVPTRGVVDAMLGQLIRRGLRAKLDQSPPIVGSRQVALAVVQNAPAARLMPGTPYPWLPATTNGDIGVLTDKAESILTKVDTLPIAEIGDNLRGLTHNLTVLTGSPKVRDSLDHLDRTLKTLDKTMQQTAPKIAPLIDTLRHAADEAQGAAAAAGQVLGANGAQADGDLPTAVRQLSEASRSIRSLADYLSRHPEAIIRGKKESR